MSMFHLIYIPETPLHDRSKFIKGNGDHRGCPAGHRLKSLSGQGNILYGSGCSAWGDCFTCPKAECSFDYSREFQRKRQHEKDAI